MRNEHVTLGLSVLLAPGTTAIPFNCKHCGDQVMLVAPIGLDSMCSFARWYEDEHAECVLNKKENENGT